MSSVDSGRSLINKVADLHIFVVPLDLWLDKYRTAFNNIALESVSAGFVRVPPDITLYHLRESIEEQLGEEIIPEDFIFLRSVGRCMAVVKRNQERLLRAADFLPPVAYSPEIFLLPGLHETYARPASDSNNVVIATHGHTTAGLSLTQPLHLPAIPQQFNTNPQLVTLPQYGEQISFNYQQDNLEQRQGFRNQQYQQGMNERQVSEDSTTMQRQQKGKRQTQEQKVHFDDEYDDDEQMNGYHSDNEHRSSAENQDLQLSPRATKMDQNNVKVKNKKNKPHKNTSSDSSGSFRSEMSTEVQTLKIIQPEVIHNLPIQAANGYLVSPPTPIPSGRVISSPLPPVAGHGAEKGRKTEHQKQKGPGPGGTSRRESDEGSDRDSRNQKGSKKKRRGRSRSPSVERKNNDNNKLTQREEMVDLPNDVLPEEDVIPSLEDVEERSKFAQFPSPVKNRRSRNRYESELDSGIADDFVTPPQGLDDSLNGKQGNTNDGDSMFDSSRLNGLNADEYGLIGAHGLDERQRYRDGATGGKKEKEKEREKRNEKESEKRNEKGNEKEKGLENRAGKDAKTNKKGKRAAPKKTPRKQDDLDQQFKIPTVPSPPPLKIPTIGDAALQRDTASAKDRKQHIVEELRGELRKAKNERVDLEKQREQKVRRAKSLQTQMLQKRNQAKNIWKKKFFDEKRKTVPLEEQVNRLRYDVEVQHKAILSYLENSKEREGGSQELEKTPSQKSNQLIILARLQNEVEDLKRQVEEAKMKLASEMKMRDAAQNELKQLREDLMEKKINLTLTKSQKSITILASPENITA